MEQIVIIGGGGTGAALAHDLVLRGFKVSLYEKGELLSGTTGRHHGLLHSGARYAVHDPAAARECIAENRILRQITSDAIEPNDGLFVAVDESDLTYKEVFLESCNACGIPTKVLSPETARTLEPALNADLKLAVQVPDATMDAWRLPLQFFATAKANGARIHPYSEVTDIRIRSGSVCGVRILDCQRHREYDVPADVVVIAAGIWSGNLSKILNIHIPIQPGPGVMVAMNGRLSHMVISRLQPAGQGDIIVSQRNLSILGTTLWLTDDPDITDFPQDHVRKMIDMCAAMVPAVTDTPVHSAWLAARPLIANAEADYPQMISRTFECYDHGIRDHLEGLVSIIGGKATTMRAMAEKTADLICRKLGKDIPCKTKETKLRHYRHFYKT
jgi:glycerol-3-phosphate dehydrogenase